MAIAIIFLGLVLVSVGIWILVRAAKSVEPRTWEAKQCDFIKCEKA